MTTAFVLERKVWEFAAWDGHMESALVSQTYLEPEGEPSEDERFHPVRIFVNRESAELAMEQLERLERNDRNAFRYLEPVAEIELDPHKLVEVGIVAPVRDSDPTTDIQLLDLWWEEQSPTWTEEQREFVWSLFPQVRFYAIREIPFED